ncbi:MAG: hypothetical protein IPF57_07450 [Gammaproteobacteria bacterium]|nr:hypothetical protein [Gammaproteobacteria bacterium]
MLYGPMLTTFVICTGFGQQRWRRIGTGTTREPSAKIRVWFRFMESSGALEADEVRVISDFSAFLDSLETTQMSKSFKMVVLLAMLDHDRFPGTMGIEDLVQSVRRFVDLHPTLAKILVLLCNLTMI